ncbi:MAG: hypothetical protein ACE5OY_08665 [Candidatus Bathyarchaeia archaeon]
MRSATKIKVYLVIAAVALVGPILYQDNKEVALTYVERYLGIGKELATFYFGIGSLVAFVVLVIVLYAAMRVLVSDIAKVT